MQSVAIIGTGVMGTPMARRLHSAGYDVLACDIDAAALSRLKAEGMATTTTPSDCASCDLVLVIVATAEQVTDVLHGRNGLETGLSPEKRPLVAVMGTIGASALTDIHARAAAAGIELIDCPVSGMALRAAAGTLAIMVGAEPEQIDRAKPVLDILGEVFAVGAPGAAQTIKVLNNVIGTMNTLMVGEAYRIGLQQGMSLRDITTVLEAGSGRNWLSRDADEAARIFAACTDTRESFEAVTHTIEKDFALAETLVLESNVPCAVIPVVLQTAHVLATETFDNWRTVAGAARPEGTSGAPRM